MNYYYTQDYYNFITTLVIIVDNNAIIINSALDLTEINLIIINELVNYLENF